MCKHTNRLMPVFAIMQGNAFLCFCCDFCSLVILLSTPAQVGGAASGEHGQAQAPKQ